MRKVLFTLLFLIYISLILAATADTIEILERNKLQYAAEEAIITERYCYSIKIYDEIHEKYTLWNTDLQNALIASLYCDNVKSIEKYAAELLRRGAPPIYFERELQDFTFFSSSKWKNLKKKNFSYTYNPDLRKTILKMRERDQKDRYDETSRPIDDYLNLIELNKIIVEQGFPTQLDLGFDYYKEDLNYNRYFYNILLHLVKLQPWDFGKYLQELYYEQKISSANFIYLFTFAETCDDLQLTCLEMPASNVIFIDSILFSCTKRKMVRINNNRKLFYLDSVEDQIKKLKFRKNNPNVPWCLDTGYSTFNYNKRKYDFESISKKLLIENKVIPYDSN